MQPAKPHTNITRNTEDIKQHECLDEPAILQEVNEAAPREFNNLIFQFFNYLVCGNFRTILDLINTIAQIIDFTMKKTDLIKKLIKLVRIAWWNHLHPNTKQFLYGTHLSLDLVANLADSLDLLIINLAVF